MLLMMLALVGRTLALHALDTSVDVNPLSLLANYGLAGIILLLVITGQLRTKAEVAQAVKIADERAKEIAAKDVAIAALMDQITGNTMPSVARLAQVIDALPKPPSQQTQQTQASAERELLDRLSELTMKIDRLEKGGG